MIQSTRTINSLLRLIIFSCLLIACSNSFGFFKKPQWLHLPHDKNNFWSKMSEDFAIDSEANNPEVQKQIQWYQQHPKHLQNILKRAEPFIHYVYDQTRTHNLPAELALIPLLESQYNPTVGAPSGAAGLWQIMPGTARKFGLKMNHSYDGRRDISASTKAALTYLSYLHHYFKRDWLLALAAYDAGEGKIQAIARRYEHNFWQMPLSHETKQYVPKLLALAHIIKKPEAYNLTLPHITNEATVQEMTWKEAKVINLTQAAKGLGIDDKTLKQFNPGIRNNVATIPHSFTLLVPSYINPDNAVLVAETMRNENSTPFDEQENSSEPDHQSHHKISQHKKVHKKSAHYKIRSGDTLNSIAKKFHVSAKHLKSANHLKNEKQLKIGHSLLIP